MISDYTEQLRLMNRTLSVASCRTLDLEHKVLRRPRNAYACFDNWWAKAQSEDRKCYTLQDPEGNIRGVAVVDPRGDKVVKLCTFCLIEGESGTGVTFVNAVCHKLHIQGFSCVYGSILPQHKKIRDFFKRAGFKAPTESHIQKQLENM